MILLLVVFGTFNALFQTIRIRKSIRNGQRLRNEGIRTVGVVIGHKTRWNRSLVFYPRIQFATLGGGIVEVEGPTGASLFSYHEGSKVALFYEAEDPKNFALDSNQEQTAPYYKLVLMWLIVAVFYYIWLSSE